VSDLTLGRFGAVLDFSLQLRLDPDAAKGDLFRVGLSFADQRLEPLPEIGDRLIVETVVDFARVPEVLALAPAEIKAVPILPIECKAGDRQRLALLARLLYPDIPSARYIGAVANL
jgi:hypothetical protein